MNGGARRTPKSSTISMFIVRVYTVEPGYNDIGLSDTSSITSDILWYQLIPHC
jgi:hypothetical protein